jgi:CO/xanthine dehydrogenase Mo-binding subunit
MSERWDIEFERYELREPARYRFDCDRRDFLRILSAMGGGLLVVAAMDDGAGAQESGRGGQGSSTNELGSWLHINPDGKVTAFTGKVEIGQNIRTMLAQVVADELRVPLASISMVMADTDLTPFDQGTFGSRTTPTMAPVLARAAATARELLIDRAAARWQAARDSVTADAGRVSGTDGRTVTYAELIAAGDLKGVVAVSTAIAPKARWKTRGMAVKKVNGADIVSGRHAYTPDLVRPGMLHGRVIRPPAYGSKLKSVDPVSIRAIAGVEVVRDGDFVGLTAPSERVLTRALDALKTEWTEPLAQPDSTTIYDHLKKTATEGGGRGGGGGGQPSGDVAAARTSASVTLSASYRIPYIAHVPLEPRAAVAEWTGDRVTIWTGTQRPFGVRTEVAQAFHIAEDRVRVIVPDMGSGYGGKHTGEQAIEAARLARAAGKPVKLVYTRAEEFMWGYFRPAGVIDVVAAVDAGGRLVAWEFDNYNSGSAGLPTPYSVSSQRVVSHGSDSPLRQGSYRGLAATANHYAREMHMDAIARKIGADAVEFRRRHITEPRLRAVLDAVAERVAWSRSRPAGKAVGIACGTEKGSYVATAAEVSKTPAGFTVDRLIVAFECGAIVNPDGLHNQVEGSIVQGLGGALFEAIEFGKGQLANGSMREYRVPRFKDVPPIDIILLDRPDLPSAGAGETPIVCVAPAIGTAVRAFGEVETVLPVRLMARA